jgi:hypothetical protein
MPFRPQNGVDLANQRIVNVADASNPTDAVTLQQLQNYLAGLAWKQPVRVATTTNGALATAFAAGQSVDGVTLAAGMRILLKDQSTASENGIYVVAGTGAPTRATDADSLNEIQNAAVYVVAGTTNADRNYVQTVNDVTPGTTGQTWVQQGVGQTYTPGNGITITANTVSAVAAPGGGLSVGATGIAIDSSVVARKVSQNLAAATAGSPQTVTHGLGSLDVDVAVIEVSTGQDVEPDVFRTSTNTVSVTFASAISAGQFRIVVQG